MRELTSTVPEDERYCALSIFRTSQHKKTITTLVLKFMEDVYAYLKVCLTLALKFVEDVHAYVIVCFCKLS